ncbi:MAG: amidohydrolase [Candidatus Marinimicrobia bacterium]|nr:amidohydrolase [Candidatus Neomarinimicrobiota bacterium]
MINFLSLALICSIAFGCAREAADKIFINAVIYTMNSQNEIANSIAVKDEKILYIGNEEDAYNYSGDKTEIIDLQGETVVPGFTDAHTHIAQMGKFIQSLNLTGTKSAQVIADNIRYYASTIPPGELIEGLGWDQNDWEVKKFPTFQILTDAAPDNPVILLRIGRSTIWVNKKTLELAGITAETPDPEGGQILRIPGSNEPSGLLRNNAMSLVNDVRQAPSKDLKKRRIVETLSYALKLGITTLHDTGSDSDHLEIYKELAAEGKLVPRVYAMIQDEEILKEKYFKLGPQIGLYDDYLNIRTMKFLFDGTLGSRGAALLEPYSDDPGNSGMLSMPEDELRSKITNAANHGFQVSAHAIGDRSGRLILDIYEQLTNGRENRHRIEHSQTLSLDDIPRFKKLGVIPSMQPTHQSSDMYWVEDRLGSERLKGAYAWRKLIDAGVVIAGGSDAPVESLNPLWGIYAAVTRQDHKGFPENGWYPEERMTMEEAVKMFTSWAAYASFEEDLKGTLETGKLADFTVLSKDIFTIEPPALLKTRVLMTVIGGNIRYDNFRRAVAMGSGSLLTGNP